MFVLYKLILFTYLTMEKKFFRLTTNFPSRSNWDLQELHNYAVSVSAKPNTRPNMKPNIDLTSEQLLHIRLHVRYMLGFSEIHFIYPLHQ